MCIRDRDKNEISIIQDTKEHVNQDTTKKRKIVTLTGFEGIFVNSYEIDAVSYTHLLVPLVQKSIKHKIKTIKHKMKNRFYKSIRVIL